MVPRRVLCAIAVLAVVTGAVLYGCHDSTRPPQSCSDGAVDLQIVADQSLSDELVASIATFDVTSVATENFTDASAREQDTFTAGAWMDRQQVFHYHPPVLPGPLDVSVTARDVHGRAVAYGDSLAGFADCGQIGTTITLTAAPLDMGLFDLARFAD